MLEYEDYQKNSTIGNASEFISRALEDNAVEALDREGYARYIATRPRVERYGSHGLFTDDDVEIQLSKVTEEINAHGGNIWTVILSCGERMPPGWDMKAVNGGGTCSGRRL